MEIPESQLEEDPIWGIIRASPSLQQFLQLQLEAARLLGQTRLCNSPWGWSLSAHCIVHSTYYTMHHPP
jgi:hypothetical protein